MHRPLRLIVDRSAIQSNWRWLADFAGVAAGAAVKADGYGLGARETTEALIQAGCRVFFVSTWAEAEALGNLPEDVSLIVLHGVNGRGANMRTMGFEPSATTNGTVVVYPDALGGSWNDGRVGMEPMQPGMVTDDVAFLRSLIDEMVSRANVDETRVAVAGFSNGAMMASRVACEMPDRVHGIALVGGTGGQNYAQVCKPLRSVPIVEVHGTNDPIVPYAGGKVADNQGHKRGSVLSVPEFMSFWSSTCHCAGTRETSIKAALAVTMIEAQSCTLGSPVVQYRVNGGSHEWFRIQGFDTTKVIWDFLAANTFA